jgi:hypothetical protein
MWGLGCLRMAANFVVFNFSEFHFVVAVTSENARL